MSAEAKAKLTFDDPYIVLRHVVMTEKAVRMVELQNKLVFVVDKKFGKDEIKQAAAAAFNAEIMKVNTVIDQRGRKKAYIRFAKPGQAGDIAVRLGII
ncbi:MAG: 50S ribosomal protein L23 [Candidatus Aenigmarchaeota archaeon]|nr:50S ribosomal protein L23 [Candidatus Aenigmarchaeota archaeon]